MTRKSLAAAFPVTVPVLMGYLSIGIAFGLMLDDAGYNFIWSFLMSLTIYAGSGQFMGAGLLKTGAGIMEFAIMTLIINLRHLVYGISMLDKFRGMGLRKLYMIFSLTDETYALLAGVEVPEGISPKEFYFSIAVLDQSYWILGSVIGSVAGALLRFNTDGVSFAMTALFIVIAVEQWKTSKSHLPAILGAVSTIGALLVLALLLISSEKILLIALPLILFGLLLLRRRVEKQLEKEESSC
jgi:4-azaleucine resistance transporter AzlC